jgi:hypothetical protein
MKKHHKFKVGQFWKRTRDGLLYKVVDCRQVCTGMYDCKVHVGFCGVNYALQTLGHRPSTYCAIDCFSSPYLESVSDEEVMLKDY